MNKILRYSFMALMAMFVGTVFAQKTVTIDFDNDYQTLFPTLAGVSSNDSQDGDFKETTTSTPVDGVMVVVSPDEGASTPSRIWGSSPRLRMYSGTFAVMSMTGLPITKIEFTAHSKNFNLTPTDGTLTESVWTGSTQSAIFSVSKNTQISSIVVTLGGGGDNPGGGDDDDDKFVSDFTFQTGKFTDSENQMVFDFSGVAELKTGEKVDVTGSFAFTFENEICTSCTESITYPTEALAQLAYQSAMDEQEEEGYSSVTKDGLTVAVTSDDYNGISRIVLKSTFKILLDDEEIGYGILESPLTPNLANVYAGTLDAGKTSTEDIYIKGKIASIKEEFSSQYGNATFSISLDGANDFTFLVFRALYLENKSWKEGNTQIKVGDDVIICGKVINYKGNTPETAQGQAYIYSLNGQTKNEIGDIPGPQGQEISVAKALEIIDALENGKTTSEEYLVKGYVVGTPDFQRKGDGSLYGNVNFDIADEKGGTTKLTIFRAKNFENAAFTEETISSLKENDEVIVRGKLQKYVKNDVVTPELTNGYLVSVTAGIQSVTKERVNAPIYNLAGQRVDANYKGVVIQNGKKFVVK